jgi:hypothetical protein
MKTKIIRCKGCGFVLGVGSEKRFIIDNFRSWLFIGQCLECETVFVWLLGWIIII